MINVIKASAGSGKTYQLTYEYIKLLIGTKNKGRYELADAKERERHRHILAVTFTNKATGEMKERIIKELSVLAGRIPGKDSPYMTALCKELRCNDQKKIKSAAYRALVDLLFDYTNFNVSTIDSFFQMILRTFAKELKMSYNYDIELDDDYAIRVGVNDFLSSLAHDKGISPDNSEAKRIRRAKSWIKEFVKNEVTGSKSWNIFLESETSEMSKNKFGTGFSFNDFAQCLTKEELKSRIDDIVAYLGYDENNDNNRIVKFKSFLYEKMQSVKHDALLTAEEVLRLSATDGLEKEDLSSNGGLMWILKISKDNKDCGLSDYPVEKILSSVDKSEKWFKKGKSKNAPRLSENTIDNIKRCIYVIAECKNKFLIYKEMHRNVYMLGLLSEISRYLSKFRKENDLILLADTNELLHKIINNEDAPFVYERVGIWLSHFLIDEFQDTSRAQWDNMRPLLFNSCAEGSDNLIIGDEKQCIYRFRNADPSLLRTEVNSHFTVRQNDSGKCINWRSSPRIIEFNNTFFSTIAPMLGAKNEYANVVQSIPKDKQYTNNGYVSVQFVEENKDSGSGSYSKFKDIVLEKLPSLILDLTSRGYGYNDIAILVSTNSQGAEVIKHILDYNMSKDEIQPIINVVSNESLMLKNSSAVRLIISYLRYLDTKMLHSSAETDSEKEDMKSYAHRIQRNYESLMFKQNFEPGEALERSFATTSRDNVTETATLSALLPENTESFNIVSITEHIIAQNISEDDLKHENAFVQAFQDSIIEFSNRPNATIHDFLHWWDKGGCNTSVNSPEGQDAINVLTIHKSKGLEYKCVIIPFCDWDIAGKDEVLWIPKDVAENSGLFIGLDKDIIPPLIPLLPKIDMGIENSGLKNFYEEKLKSRIIDSLNKTYVGFTRAVDELYIFTPAKKDDKKGKKTRPTMMNELLSVLELTDENEFISGEKGSLKKSVNNDNISLKMPLYKVHDVKMEYTTPDLYVDEHRKKGTRLHNVFKKIRYKDDADSALLYYRVCGAIPKESYDEDCNIVKTALEDDRVQEWFNRNNRVYNERSLIHQFKKSRPDRFIITPDGRTIVIDYKFGEVHSNVYRKQVTEYMEILKEAGFKNIEGYLWYPLEQIIEKIEE